MSTSRRSAVPKSCPTLRKRSLHVGFLFELIIIELSLPRPQSTCKVMEGTHGNSTSQWVSKHYEVTCRPTKHWERAKHCVPSPQGPKQQPPHQSLLWLWKKPGHSLGVLQVFVSQVMDNSASPSCDQLVPQEAVELRDVGHLPCFCPLSTLRPLGGGRVKSGAFSTDGITAGKHVCPS